MSKLKPSSKKVAMLEAEVARLEREIGKITAFAEGVRSDFWKRIEDKFKGELENIDRQLDTYRKLTDYQVRDLLADRLRLRGFIGIKDYVKTKTIFENKLTILKQKIREENERLSDR